MGVPDRVFKALMRMLPAEFRGEYEREMSATFRSERRDANGAVSLTRVWIATIVDVLRTAPGEHLDILRRDLGHTFRMLARRPTLTFTALLTLALGIGANTAIFSVVNGVLFAPLPYPAANRVVLIEEARGDRDPGTTGYLSFEALRGENASFDRIAALAGWSAILAGDGRDAERIIGARVTWEYFRTLGLQPALGRDFDHSEDHPERRRVAIISDELWQRRYGSDRTVIGRPITINQIAYTLAGVMPEAAADLGTARKFPETEIWTLLGYAGELPQACRTCRHIHVVGRLKRGMSAEQAEADLTRIYQSLGTRFPADFDRPRAVVTPVRDYFLGPVKTPLYLLWGAVGLLLVMTCANIANLLLIRASEREEEIAVRRALGVSPAQLLRQLLTEAVVLAMIGGAAGAVLAWWGTSVLRANGPDAIPRLTEVTVNARVLLYAIGVSLVTGVVFGMAPARLLVVRRDVAGVAARRITAGPGAWRYRAALVTVNVALSVLLLVGSGLLVRSFLTLMTVDAGFNPQSLLTFEIALTGEAYGDNAGITRFYDQLSERLRARPDVVSVSASTQLPVTGSIDRSGITIEGRTVDNPAAAPNADRYAVRPDYFTTMGIRLLRGRVFSERDQTAAAPVAIVGQTMAEELWPGDDPLGQRIRVAGGPNNPFRTIVGVVADVRHYGLHLPATLQVYIPHAQTHYSEPYMTMVVRTAQDLVSIAPAAREEVRGIDPLQPVTKIRTYEGIVAESMATRRFTLVLLGLFAGTALVLAVVGLYGAVSYVVTQRQRELGVRVALGATAREIRRLVLRLGMTPAVLGVLAGVVMSAGVARVIESMLYGTSPIDLPTFAVVTVVMTASALVACVLPARRAAGVDPAITLKAE
ncbi:MAG TPA: ABC transporter permease [Vicinamibacterales bacterium]|nr:ABC transporter permease [Vicinamibacterales bacterium]